MGTRPRKKQQHRLERWQILLAAAVAAIASIAVALINLIPSESPPPPPPSVDITGLTQQPYPPPPGQLFLWTGTVTGQPSGSSVYVIDKIPGGNWLVSPSAIISGGNWTITWTIPKPPASARWIAVVFSGSEPTPCCQSLEHDGPDDPRVIATATYQPRARPSSLPTLARRAFTPAQLALALRRQPGSPAAHDNDGHANRNTVTESRFPAPAS
jgi:hypothetical protein